MVGRFYISYFIIVFVGLWRLSSFVACDIFECLVFHGPDSLVFVVTPPREDLHSLNVLDRCELVPVVLVATKRVEADLLSQTFVLSLDDFQNISNLLAVVDLVIVDAYH